MSSVQLITKSPNYELNKGSKQNGPIGLLLQNLPVVQMEQSDHPEYNFN